MSISTASGTVYDHNHDWAAFSDSVKATFEVATKGNSKVFTVETKGLYDLYLNSLPGDRQTHVCHTCRHFFSRVGGLVCITEAGETRSALWDESTAPAFYQPTAKALRDLVERLAVQGVFCAEGKVWGTPSTPDPKRGKVWDHFAVDVPTHLRHTSLTKTPFQVAAERLEDFRTVGRAITQRYSADALATALRLLRAEALDRSEKFVAPVQWLLDRVRERAGAKNRRLQDQLLWRAIASAPAGFCHPASSVVGPLLEAIADGATEDEVKGRW